VTTPSVGTGGSVNGANFPPGRFGGGVLFDLDGERISLPSSGNFDPAQGAIELWYRPFYDYGAGAGDDFGLFGYWIDATHYFYAFHQPGATAADGLAFQIENGANFSRTVLGAGPSFPQLWRANDWVHLRFVWRAASVGPQRLDIYVNGVRAPPSPTSLLDYPSPVPTEANFYVGDRERFDAFANNANGIIDEFQIYSSPDAPQPLAHGGLTSEPTESLADPTRNLPLPFDPIGAFFRGEYLYIGADAKFRGLNVALATPGSGIAAGALLWEYWDGSRWSNLETAVGVFTDETDSFTRSRGSVFWDVEPGAWSPYSISGGPELYYVRASLGGGVDYATTPIESVIKTDILLFQHCADVTATTSFVFTPPLPLGTTADVVVTKSDGLASAVAGNPISYTITVRNNGPDTVTELDVVDTLPPELLGAAFTESDGTYDPMTSLWSGLNLVAPTGTATLTLDATIDPSTTAASLTNSVTVGTRSLVDPVLPNTAGDVDTLTQLADLVVLKTDAPDPVPTDGNLVYTITVRNDGPSRATGVILTDTLPGGALPVTFLSVTPGPPTCSHAAGTVSCNLPPIDPATFATVTIEVRAPSSTGSITNSVTVSSPVSDPDPADNTANEATSVALADQAMQFFTVTSTQARNVLEWRTPALGLDTQIRYNKAPTNTSSCSEPTATTGTAISPAPPPFAGNANQSLVHDAPPLENDTTYCYGIFVKLTASPDTFSAGRFARGRPFVTTGPVKWSFSTGATSVAPATVSATAAYVVSNDRALYAIQRSATGGRWLVGPGPWVSFRMGQPVQSRPVVVPTVSVPGATEVVLLGSQDGHVYAVDSIVGGSFLWQSNPVLAGGMVQAAPAGIFQDFGATIDRVLVGSRNSSGSSEFASLSTTDGSVLVSFTNPPDGVGIVSGMASVDYASNRVYFVSRTLGASLNTLWCLTLPTLGSCWAGPGVPLTDIDGSPVGRGSRIYVGDTSGTVHVVKESDGSEEWSFATGDGGVKGFLFPDRSGDDLFFSTTNKVWSLSHSSGLGSQNWETPLAGGARPSVVLWAPGTKFVYVGGSDGHLHEIDFTSATLVTPPFVKRVKLGDGMAVVGAPSLDRTFGIIYVGTEAGYVYAVQTPLP